jgi:hypothetical protein
LCIKDENGKTPLHFISGDLLNNATQMLISNVNMKNKPHYTLLQKIIVLRLLNILFEQCHADANVRDEYERMSSEEHYFGLLKYLIEGCHGDFEAKDNDGKPENGIREYHQYLVQYEYSSNKRVLSSSIS